MKKILSKVFLGLVCAVCVAGACSGESLWSDAKGSLFGDFRAHKKGDILTVLVVESATSTQKATTGTSRSSNFDIGPGHGFLFGAIPNVKYGGTSDSKGDGSTARSSNLVTQLAVTVTEVMENGNLVVQGERELQTNEEKQKLVLTGVVRPVDVSPDNKVSSTSIADARIELVGNGPIGARQKEGIFTRIIRFLF